MLLPKDIDHLLAYEIGSKEIARRLTPVALRLAGSREELPDALVLVVNVVRELRATQLSACWECLRRKIANTPAVFPDVGEVGDLAADLLDERAGLHAAGVADRVGELAWRRHDFSSCRDGWVDLSAFDSKRRQIVNAVCGVPDPRVRGYVLPPWMRL